MNEQKTFSVNKTKEQSCFKKKVFLLFLIVVLLILGGLLGAKKGILPSLARFFPKQSQEKESGIKVTVDREKNMGEKEAIDLEDEKSGKEADQEDEISEQQWEQLEVELIKKCDKGEWVTLKNNINQNQTSMEEFEGKLELVLEEKNGTESGYYQLNTAEGEKAVITEDAQGVDILNFFNEKKVVIRGKRKGETGIVVKEIKCQHNSAEVKKDIQRQKIMQHIKENIIELSPKKGNLEIEDFWWPNDEYVYVEYSRLNEKKEDENDGEEELSLLLKVREKNGTVTVEQAAFMILGVDDWEIISGKNLFQDQEDMDFYEFNEVLKKWIKVD